MLFRSRLSSKINTHCTLSLSLSEKAQAGHRSAPPEHWVHCPACCPVRRYESRAPPPRTNRAGRRSWTPPPPPPPSIALVCRLQVLLLIRPVILAPGWAFGVFGAHSSSAARFWCLRLRRRGAGFIASHRCAALPVSRKVSYKIGHILQVYWFHLLTQVGYILHLSWIHTIYSSFYFLSPHASHSHVIFFHCILEIRLTTVRQRLLLIQIF